MGRLLDIPHSKIIIIIIFLTANFGFVTDTHGLCRSQCVLCHYLMSHLNQITMALSKFPMTLPLEINLKIPENDRNLEMTHDIL